MNSLQSILASGALMISVAIPAASVLACTRVFWNDNSQAMVVARTMDLFRSDAARMVISPRGIERMSRTNDGKTFPWKARYGTVAITALGIATSDGMNERGVAVNLLYLDKEVYETRDARPGLANTLWAQYVLDKFGRRSRVGFR